MQIELELKKALTDALNSEFGINADQAKVLIEVPPTKDMGDYASNVAMMFAKEAKQSPRNVAEKLIAKLAETRPEYVTKIEIAGPGFLNFYIEPGYYKQFISQYFPEYFKNNQFEGKKIMVEYADPNPFKEFHIGHLMPGVIGETIARLLEAAGADVKRACYQGDVGLHVAKAIRGMQVRLEDLGIDEAELESKFTTKSERAKFLGESYAAGATLYEEDDKEQSKIKELNKKIYDQDESIKVLYDLGKGWSLEYFETIYKLIGINRGKAFDYYYLESQVAEFGKQYVLDNIDNGIFVRSEGAVIFPGEKYGLHSRVFINSQGLPTYEAKELSLAPRKYEDFKYDKSIIVTGNEITEYFKVLVRALSLINPDLAEKTKHITNGMLRLPEGKMSSRKGNVITAEWLINEASKEPLERLTSSEKIGEGADLNNLATKIGVSAIKYSLLKVVLGKDIEFDIKESLSLQGDTGPSILYAYTRAHSIISSTAEQTLTDVNLNEVYNSEWEVRLLKLIYAFPGIVADASRELAPHLIANFAYDLTQAFNNFYANCQVLNAESGDLKQSRLYLVKVTSQVIEAALDLLGIETVDRM